MPERELHNRRTDILQAIEAIQQYIEGVDENSFGSDSKTVDAILFNFLIIGEATTRLPEDFKAQHPEVPWRSMAAMRNFVAHVYWGINPRILWETILDDLPPLVPRLEAIVATL